MGIEKSNYKTQIKRLQICYFCNLSIILDTFIDSLNTLIKFSPHNFLISSSEYPLFTSGRRFANKYKAQYDLDTLCIQQQEVVQKIDVRVVKAIDNMRASYDQIFFDKKT